MLIVTAARGVAPGNLGTVRVCGTDGIEIVAAARLVGAGVMVTRRGAGWFSLAADALPLVRDKFTVVSPSAEAWHDMARRGAFASPVTGGGGYSPAGGPDAGAPVPPAPAPAPPSLSVAAVP